jgi:hypothetical protein
VQASVGVGGRLELLEERLSSVAQHVLRDDLVRDVGDAMRSATISRARYSVSARLRSARWRSCSICTRSRSSCRFCASRMRGAAYEACSERISVSRVKFVDRGSNCSGTGREVFHGSQTTTKIVMPMQEPDVPIPRANASENRPKRSRDGLRVR